MKQRKNEKLTWEQRRKKGMFSIKKISLLLDIIIHYLVVGFLVFLVFVFFFFSCPAPVPVPVPVLATVEAATVAVEGVVLGAERDRRRALRAQSNLHRL